MVVTLGMVSSLVFMACSGEDGVDGVNGADGTSCYAKALKDSSGFELYCGDEYVGTLKNGEDGAKGDAGAPGENGSNGENGKNGTSCTVEPLASKDGFKVICAGDSVGVVLNGTNGTNGTNGENGLSAYEIAVAKGFTGTEEEWIASLKGDPGAAGTSCTAEEVTGGVKITCTDGKTYTLSNGADGKDGRNFDEDWMVDPRDRQLYRVVTIGEQTWMAHNLNYETEEGSYCYKDSTKYCTKYGRLYTWAAATTACPEGWHLPTKAEFETLFTAVGGPSTAGKVLKSTSGWKSSGNGSDAFAFSALPAGGRDDYGYYGLETNIAYFWSSTEDGSLIAYYMDLYYHSDGADLDDRSKDFAFSVRCVKD